MLYSIEDFKNLETLTDEDLKMEISDAKEKIAEVQDYFKQLEDEAVMIYEKPSLSILFSNINNLEAYIRRAKNLLRVYDANRYIQKAYDNRQANLILLHNTIDTPTVTIKTKKKKKRI